MLGVSIGVTIAGTVGYLASLLALVWAGWLVVQYVRTYTRPNPPQYTDDRAALVVLVGLALALSVGAAAGTSQMLRAL